MNNITVIGSGYVGLVVGTCLADMGNNVVCLDNNKTKIDQLNNGNVPIYEPGLEKIVIRNLEANRLKFTTNTTDAVRASKIIYIAVGTPPMEDGSADIKHVLHVSEDIGRYMDEYKLIVIKSTVPVGTGQKVKDIVGEVLKDRGVQHCFSVISNPEFLREGSAINDFINPDRIILGIESSEAKEIMLSIYKEHYKKGVPFLFTNLQTAELIKYASNAFLAMKVTFINEMAQVCEEAGADVGQLAQGVGMDKRIGLDFLKPGPGYGGSCFPKDTKAIVKIGMDYGVNLSLIQQTIESNEQHKRWIVDRISKVLSDLHHRTIGILGMTFKAETDDMRESPSLTIIERLAGLGAKLRIFDPWVNAEDKWMLEPFEQSIEFCKDEYDAADGTEALVIITDWAQFMQMDLRRIFELMKEHNFFDLRNMFNRSDIEKRGFAYFGIGR